MSRTDRADAARWYHSLYWRIMVGFILVVVGVIAGTPPGGGPGGGKSAGN